MFTEATGKEPPPEPQTQRRDVAADGRRLAPAIVARFDLAEMRDLAVELGIDAHVGGETRADMAMQLVKPATQRGLSCPDVSGLAAPSVGRRPEDARRR